jgi:hypothetical protein
LQGFSPFETSKTQHPPEIFFVVNFCHFKRYIYIYSLVKNSLLSKEKNTPKNRGKQSKILPNFATGKGT